MKAVQLSSFGGAEVLDVRDVGVPRPGPYQVRIRVEAAAVNPVDLQTRTGALVRAGVMLPVPQVGLGEETRRLAPGGADAVIDAASLGLAALDADRTHRVARTHPLEHVRAVHELMEAGGERGKHVLIP